jgi:hypothetical protein
MHMGLDGLLGDSFTFVYADYARTAQETHLWTYMAFYGVASLYFFTLFNYSIFFSVFILSPQFI